MKMQKKPEGVRGLGGGQCGCERRKVVGGPGGVGWLGWM